MSALTLGAAVLLGGAVAATFGSSPVGVGRVADMRAAFRTPDGANDATHEPTSATPSPTPVIDPSKAPVMPALPAGPGVARPD